VRVPGARAMARRAEQLAHGVSLHPSIGEPLEACGNVYGVRLQESRTAATRLSA
jgi:hypothetical protein